jgi:hypothetical protein
MIQRMLSVLLQLRKQWYTLFFISAAVLLITSKSEEICKHPSKEIRYFGLPYDKDIQSPSPVIPKTKEPLEKSDNQE